ncbi:AI-2E family transporter [Enterococcus sp. LJL90]
MGEENKKKFSWFWRWFLNNQVVTALLIVLLVLLIILTFTKVSYLFEPVGQFLAVVGLPIILSAILYYLLNPVVDYLEKKKVPRVVSIILVFILIVLLLIWGIVALIPRIQEQVLSFANNFSSYANTLNNMIDEITSHPIFGELSTQLDEIGQQISSSIGSIVQNISQTTFKGIGNIVGTVATIVVAIVTMPFILFYLLKDGKRLADYFLKFLPTKWRQPTYSVLSEMNQQVSSYIRGQLTVAFLVAVMFIIGFTIVGLDYAVTLGILAGFLNLIPYLGSFLAMIPAVFIALVISPFMLVKVIIVFIIEQTIEGRFVSPLILGSQLAIHPVTILLVLLTSGRLFGVVGVILGVPVYAAAKVVISHIFDWYRSISSLYQDEPETDSPSDKETKE